MKSRIGVGIVGFGNFGRFMCTHLRSRFNIRVHDRLDVADEAAQLGVKSAPLPEVAASEILVLAVPVQNMEEVLRDLRGVPRLPELVMDVGSVKVKPLDLMARHLPKRVEIVGTHPMFGPQSGRHGIAGLKVVLCPLRTRRLARIRDFLSRELRLEVLGQLDPVDVVLGQRVQGRAAGQPVAAPPDLLQGAVQGDLEGGELAVDVVVGLLAQPVRLGTGVGEDLVDTALRHAEDLGVRDQPVALVARVGDDLLGPTASFLHDLVALPLQNLLTRRIEARADAHALVLTDDPSTVERMEERLATTNLADVDPPRWHYVIFASHPSIVERMAAARAYGRGER